MGNSSVSSFIFFVWYAATLIQMALAYGTAYRKTKANGDNGVSLAGWLLVYVLAAYIPYLGIHLWKNSKKDNVG
ncbi:hypothetical protein I6N95_09490 [Vagococcus sp. BWB3-3]|uniref:Uncharacterized protein n=1 Tax=Vagococcus allomyrinae TaxID=2794353 RepID=A0A940PC11_9ENTE|nr:hypothetical protein [Vagococcus allomyrinae]MBP1041238.1 hypothetical protein [Vagococcus allomyrinae]